jgi:hypothetical protein
MRINQATTIVCRAALANANGAGNADEVIAAVAFLRAYIADQDEPAPALDAWASEAPITEPR